MGSKQDDVLSLESDDSFSGFSTVPSGNDSPTVTKKKRRRLRSVVSKKNKTPGNKKGKESVPAKTQSGQKASDSVIDLNNLSSGDVNKLREVLGIQQASLGSEETFPTLGDPRDQPNLRIEVDRNDISDNECCGNPGNVGNNMAKALFGTSEEEESETENSWSLPKLKAPSKGKAIPQSLADMINVSCTSQCDVDGITSKYKVPENCDKACPPMVNSEIWKILDKRSQTQDRGIVDIQNLVASGMTPIIRLAEILKKQISSNAEAKMLFSDSLVILGQVQYFLSIMRRYMIRPALKKKYQGLCSISMPVTTQLFGDDVAKEIKSCDSLTSIGKEQRFPVMRGRGNPRFGRRPYSSTYQSGYGNNRFSPYPTRGQSRPARFAGYRIPRKTATATSTVPNDQN